MQLLRLALKAKVSKIFTCLMALVMFSLLWLAQPVPAEAGNQRNNGYPAAEQLEIWVGYSNDSSKTYIPLKTFQQSELESMQQRHVYTFIDNLPCTVVDPAEGAKLTDILEACGIAVNDVKNFRFWTSDVPNTPYQTLTREFLLDMPKYYFPCITDNWELVESGFYDPTTGYSGTSEIYFPDSVAASAYAVEVPTMLAFRDNWQRVFSGGSGDTSYSNLVDAVRYRLVFGHPGGLASDHPTHTASRSAMWIYRMDVTLDVAPIALNKTTATIDVGSTEQLSATINPSTASQSVTWSSSNTGVATVDSSGLVTGVAPGTANITATTVDGGFTATCAVTVDNTIPANAVYIISPIADAVYQVGSTDDGIKTMTVNADVSGLKYFAVQITPVSPHEGLEAVVFVHQRNGVQVSLNVTKADFDAVGDAQAGFNVEPGDLVKAYIVDDLTNAVGFNPTILQ